jgi:sulfatase-like protein
LPRSLRYAIVALSLANLCFLSPWLVLLNPQHYTYYNWPKDPGLVEIKALVICIVVLGFLFWLAATLVGRIRSRSVSEIARLAVLLIVILPLNSFIEDYVGISISNILIDRRWRLLVAFALAVVVLVIAYKHNRPLARFVITLLIILSPLFLVNLVSAIWLRSRHLSSQSFQESRPTKPVSTRANTPHIVWIIFDELDQRTAFISRSREITLPVFDRFKSQSLSSSNALPPNKYTVSSIPALTIGRSVADSTPLAPNECELKLDTGEKVRWSEESNVFSQARSEGYSTGVSGWYLPYCRVIGGSFDWCSWVPVVDRVNPALDQLTLSRAIWISMRTAAFRIPFAFRLLESRYERQRKLEHREEFVRVSKASRELLQQDLNLKLLHFPIPHHPWIYDAKAQSFTAEARNGYEDNLVLADRTLSEIRVALEGASKWDSSIVVVTADHWWRLAETVNGKQDQRVPFMIKMAGQKAGMEYQKPFNTILTRQLLIEILRGNLTSPADVAAWMDRTSASH